jgi:hypothetical protein
LLEHVDELFFDLLLSCVFVRRMVLCVQNSFRYCTIYIGG